LAIIVCNVAHRVVKESAAQPQSPTLVGMPSWRSRCCRRFPSR